MSLYTNPMFYSAEPRKKKKKTGKPAPSYSRTLTPFLQPLFSHLLPSSGAFSSFPISLIQQEKELINKHWSKGWWRGSAVILNNFHLRKETKGKNDVHTEVANNRTFIPKYES